MTAKPWDHQKVTMGSSKLEKDVHSKRAGPAALNQGQGVSENAPYELLFLEHKV